MLRASVKILVNDTMVNDLCQFMVMSSEIEFAENGWKTVFKSLIDIDFFFCCLQLGNKFKIRKALKKFRHGSHTRRSLINPNTNVIPADVSKF